MTDHTRRAEQALEDVRKDRLVHRVPSSVEYLADVVAELAVTLDRLTEVPLEAQAAVADAAAERRALYGHPGAPVMVPAPTYADPDAVVPGPNRDTVDRDDLHAFRRASGRRLERIAAELGSWFAEWMGDDMPPDALDQDEYPFSRSLEDLHAEVQAAAERLATRLDDSEEREAREEEERRPISGLTPGGSCRG